MSLDYIASLNKNKRKRSDTLDFSLGDASYETLMIFSCVETHIHCKIKRLSYTDLKKQNPARSVFVTKITFQTRQKLKRALT